MLSGPILIDIEGTKLTEEDKSLLRNSLVGGIVLFTRNYVDKAQLEELIQEIRSTRTAPLLITVDQEGNRVQRFRQDFVSLPAMADIGKVYDYDKKEGLELAKLCGWLTSSELIAVGVDLNLAPVLDLNWQTSTIIGDRSFHKHPRAVAELAQAYISGQISAGMNGVGKHYPGHGHVVADSHLELPVDNRSFDEIYNSDLIPFKSLIKNNVLNILMTAHIVYNQIDSAPVTFSEKWLKNILSEQLNYKGLIMSDCLSMVGAQYIKDDVKRVEKALSAGCDIILFCNNRPAVKNLLANLSEQDIKKYQLEKPKLSQPLIISDVLRQEAKKLLQLPSWQEAALKLSQCREQGQEIY